jgi:hypothetical protein
MGSPTCWAGIALNMRGEPRSWLAGAFGGQCLLDLARLAEAAPATSFLCATRGTDLIRIYGGGDADQLPARGELGAVTTELVEIGRAPLTGFAIVALRSVDDRIIVEGGTADGLRQIGPVGRIIAATGQRPDMSLTRKLRGAATPRGGAVGR